MGDAVLMGIMDCLAYVSGASDDRIAMLIGWPVSMVREGLRILQEDGQVVRRGGQWRSVD